MVQGEFYNLDSKNEKPEVVEIEAFLNSTLESNQAQLLIVVAQNCNVYR